MCITQQFERSFISYLYFVVRKLDFYLCLVFGLLSGLAKNSRLELILVQGEGVAVW